MPASGRLHPRFDGLKTFRPVSSPDSSNSFSGVLLPLPALLPARALPFPLAAKASAMRWSSDLWKARRYS